MEVNDEKLFSTPNVLALTQLAGRLASIQNTGTSGFAKFFDLTADFTNGPFEFPTFSFEMADGFNARRFSMPALKKLNNQQTN
jgi:hypothetical protein